MMLCNLYATSLEICEIINMHLIMDNKDCGKVEKTLAATNISMLKLLNRNDMILLGSRQRNYCSTKTSIQQICIGLGLFKFEVELNHVHLLSLLFMWM